MTAALNSDGNIVTIRSRPRPVIALYQDSDMEQECPTCAAAPGAYCCRPDGQYRRTPCIARMRTRLATQRPVQAIS